MRNHFLIAALSAFAAAPAAATTDSQLWTTTTVNVKLGKEWRLSQELVERFSDNRNGLYEIESNTLVGHVVGKGVTLWGGYTHDPQYAAGHFTVMERRIREQLTVDQIALIGKGKLSARMRLEQRWRDGITGTAWRARPYLKFALPLHGKTALNLSNETFVNFNVTSFQKRGGIERMRNLITVSTPLSKRLTVEGGYLNQHGFVRNAQDTSDHVAYFALSLSL